MNRLEKIYKYLLLPLVLFLIVNTGNAQNTEDNTKHPELKKFDKIELSQQNGPTIHVIGYGKFQLSYTETIDGYTILRNKKGVYEYAERASNGDLKPSGIVAHDPGDRKRKEVVFLSNTPKHLRYKPPKLNKILEKQNRFFRLQDK